MVTLVDFDDDVARIIDSNDPDRGTRTMPIDDFLSWWDGFALVLEPYSCWADCYFRPPTNGWRSPRLPQPATSPLGDDAGLEPGSVPARRALA
jgi:hypothetical protein